MKTDLEDHQTTPTKTTLPYILPLLCLERLIDGRSQLGVVRACSRAVVANHVARFVDQELLKVPSHISSVLWVSGEILIQRGLLVSLHINLAHHGEGDSVVILTKT